MNSNDFDIIVENRCEAIVKTLSKKAEEYATERDRFHNFNVAARKRDTSPEKALMGMKVKHDVAVDDLVEWAIETPEKLTIAIINEKIGDSINYLILLEGLLKERFHHPYCHTSELPEGLLKELTNNKDFMLETPEGEEEEKYE